jgi:hypothetical protein
VRKGSLRNGSGLDKYEQLIGGGSLKTGAPISSHLITTT